MVIKRTPIQVRMLDGDPADRPAQSSAQVRP
jgi:hypothetical protein